MQKHIPPLSKLMAAGGLSLLTACIQPQAEQPLQVPITFDSAQTDSPADAPPGTCWGKTITPAVVQTTTERILIVPADISPEGTIRAPAQYRSKDTQTIVQPRKDTWHQIVCDDKMTPEFLSSLQRALTARGYHQGAITGQLDTPTKDAIARYQTEQDLPGYDLTVQAAQRLGLIVSTAQ